VAAVNAHTIVVLNSGGAVHTPWLHKVQAVLEAWYPGQMDGAAIAAVLNGAVDPSGHLPISFPASNTPSRSPSGRPSPASIRS
jgi:beta-glucosidase